MLKPDAPSDAVLLAWQLEKKLGIKRLALSDFLQQQGLGHRLSEFSDFDDENTIFGNYVIHQKVGYGSYGSVYLAHSPEGNRIAVKILDNGPESKRFQDEVWTLQSLNHSNLPTFLGSGTDPKYDKPFIAMEFISASQDSPDQAAPDLSSFLAAQSLDLAQTIQLFLQLLDGLSYCHNRDITHRDIKPRNILVSMTESGPCVKLVDFGISLNESRDESLTETQTRLGTNSYMSPEQLRAEKLTNKSDIFSVGILLYESTTGVHPFDPLGKCLPEDTNGRILYADPPRPLIELASSDRFVKSRTITLDPGRLNQLDAIVRSTLQLNQDKRPSAEGLRQQLQTFLEGGVVNANKESFRDALIRLYSKHKWPVRLAGTLVAGVLIGLVGLIYGLFTTIQKNREITNLAKFADHRAEIATNKFLEVAAATNPANGSGSDPEVFRQRIVQIANEGFEELAKPAPDGKNYLNIDAQIRFAKIQGEFYSRMADPDQARAAFEKVLQLYRTLSAPSHSASRDFLVASVRLADQELGFLRYHGLSPADASPWYGQGGIPGPAIIFDFKLVRGCYAIFDEDDLLKSKGILEAALPVAEKLAAEVDNELANADLSFIHAKLSELGYHLADQDYYDKHNTSVYLTSDRVFALNKDNYYIRVICSRQFALQAIVNSDQFHEPNKALQFLQAARTINKEAIAIREKEIGETPSMTAIAEEMQKSKGLHFLRLGNSNFKLKYELIKKWQEKHADYFLDAPEYWSTGYGSILEEITKQVESRMEEQGYEGALPAFTSPSVEYRDEMAKLKDKPWKSVTNWQKVKLGMSKLELFALFGKPTDENEIFDGTDAIYVDAADFARIAFDDADNVSYFEPPFKTYEDEEKKDEEGSSESAK